MGPLNRVKEGIQSLLGHPAHSKGTTSDQAIQELLKAPNQEEAISKHVTRFLSQRENYSLIPTEERKTFAGLIDNESNRDLLRDVIIDELERAKRSPLSLTHEDRIIALRRQQQNFLENLQEAYLRSKESNHVRSIIWKEGLGSFELKQIEAIRESDPHCGGRRGCLLNYDCSFLVDTTPDGPQYDKKEAVVVYKPRDMRVEAALAHSEESLFAKINELAGEQVVALYRMACDHDAKGSFGFAEWIPREFTFPKEGEQEPEGENELKGDEIKEYYQRVGALQLVAQLFGITDLHRQNLIVSRGTHGEAPCIMYPIDLETSFDIRVLEAGYTTGLFLDIKTPKSGYTNAIKTDTSPRGRRGLADHPEDVEEIRKGFKETKKKLLKSAKTDELTDVFTKRDVQIMTHRFVPIPTGMLKELFGENEPLCQLEEKFVTLLKNRLTARANELGVTFSLGDEGEIKRQFREDRLNGDIPYFTISNKTGKIRYNTIRVGTLKGIDIPQRVEMLEEIEIEEQTLPKQPTEGAAH